MYYFVLNKSPYCGGGVEQVVRNILENIQIDHEQITVICNDTGRPSRFKYKDIDCINLKTPSDKLLDLAFLYSQLKYAKKVSDYLKKHAKPEDVVNIHGYEYAYHLDRDQIRCRIILTAHGSGFDMIWTYLKNLPVTMWHQKLLGMIPTIWTYFVEKHSVQSVDEIISINNFTKKKLIELYGTKHHMKYQVIYNGLDKINPSPTKKTSKVSGPVALIVGSSIYRKGLDIAVAAVEKYNQRKADETPNERLTLRIVGFDEYKVAKHLEFVEYVGRVPHEELAAQYSCSDFLIFPSRWEGFPMVILEAIQYKLPFIVSAFCRAEEIPGHHEIGTIVKSLETDDWQKAISKTLSQIKSYKKNLSGVELTVFDWKKISEQYKNLLCSKK
ncbi:glycosyltransferase family 4 protein [Candidatus Woesearchaeota archaeon]|nr:glycosyltransferase family 4 protein [Candidatus Woesearchaeota archaeon]